jgi:hypothetical protein
MDHGISEMKPATLSIVEQLYDHLLTHPFFNTTIRKVLGIPPDADVTENEAYAEKMTQLIDQTITAMIVLNSRAANRPDQSSVAL